MAKMVICGYKIIALRYYLIIGKLGPVLKEAISIFEKKEGFRCSGIIEDMEIRWFELLEYPPELVLINLDDPRVEVYNIIYLSLAIGLLGSCMPTPDNSDNNLYKAPPIYGTGGEHSAEPAG